MKTSRNPLSHYTNALDKAEMKSYLAGDNLPEVTVYGIRRCVTSYNTSFLFLKFDTIGQNNMGYVETFYQDPGGGGAAGTPSAGSVPVSELDKFLNAIGLGAGVNGTVWEVFSRMASDAKILSTLANYASGVGIVINGKEIIDKLGKGGLSALSVNDIALIGLTLISIIGLITLIPTAGIAGTTTGAIIGGVSLSADFVGIAFEIWKYTNPNQQIW